MSQFLAKIAARKKIDATYLRQLVANNPDAMLTQIMAGKQRPQRDKSFSDNLKQPGLSVIAEIKRHSPSKGALAPIHKVSVLADRYLAGGARAISVLTDEAFKGSLLDLKNLSHHLHATPCPLLRKDFIIDTVQIAESVLCGADAVLLIVKLVKNDLTSLLQVANDLDIDALVEVHDEAELNLALNAKARIIGVNSRDLDTFTMHKARAFELIKKIPSECIRVAESGIDSVDQAQQLAQAGYDAVLVGEALVKASDPSDLIQAMCRPLSARAQ